MKENNIINMAGKMQKEAILPKINEQKKDNKQKKEKKPTNQLEKLVEIDILSKLDHPNILKVYEVYFFNDCYYIVT